MQLYQWQKSCLESWESNNYRGIVNVVTGAGKTVFAMAAIDHLREKYPDLRVKIVVPTIPLASQWKNELMHHAACEEFRPGFIGDGVKDDPARAVMIYIINSARTSISNHIRQDISLGHHVLLICDECHHCQSRENRKIFSFLSDIGSHKSLYHSLGLSATPFGTNHDEILRKALGDEIYRYNYDMASAEGIISPFTVCEVSASFLPEEMAEYQRLSYEISQALKKLLALYPNLEKLSQSAFMHTVSRMAHEADMDPSDPAAAFLITTYQRKRLTNLANARIACALSIIEQLPGNARILIFCERIEQAQNLSSYVQRKFGSCWGIYHSELTKQARARIMEDFREKQIRILISCRCLDEGIDVPDAIYAIVMSSSAVNRQRIQRLGRIIRRSETKDAACLYYIYIRESTDNPSYLQEIRECSSFCVRYYPLENEFSNDLYEFVSAAILREAKGKWTDAKIRELRRCIIEGLIRPDYLLPAKLQIKNQKNAKSVHERNYWITAEKIGRYFTQK